MEIDQNQKTEDDNKNPRKTAIWWSDQALETLMCFYGQNYDTMTDKNTKSRDVRDKKDRLMAELLKTLNANYRECGRFEIKSVENKLKKVRQAKRKKTADERRHRKSTGNLSPPPSGLSKEEEKAVELLKKYIKSNTENTEVINVDEPPVFRQARPKREKVDMFLPPRSKTPVLAAANDRNTSDNDESDWDDDESSTRTSSTNKDNEPLKDISASSNATLGQQQQTKQKKMQEKEEKARAKLEHAELHREVLLQERETAVLQAEAAKEAILASQMIQQMCRKVNCAMDRMDEYHLTKMAGIEIVQPTTQEKKQMYRMVQKQQDGTASNYALRNTSVPT